MNFALRTTSLIAWTLGFALHAGSALAQIGSNYYIVPFHAGVGVGKQALLEVQKIPGSPSPFSPLFPTRLNPIWSSTNNAIATVDSHGIVTGRAAGVVQIKARLPAGNIFLHTDVTVGPPVRGFSGPPSVTVMNNCEKEIAVMPLSEAALPLGDRRVMWANSDPAILALHGAKLNYYRLTGMSLEAIKTKVDEYLFNRTMKVKGRAEGTASVRILSEGAVRTIAVTVVPGNASNLVLQPSSLEIDVQETQNVIAVATNAEGCSVPNPGLTWTSSDLTVATVNATTGVVRGLKAGTTSISATTGSGATASIVAIVPAVASIGLSSGNISELDIGANRTLTATPRSASGSELANRAVNWSVSGGSVSVSPHSGYTTTVTGVGVGTSMVVANSEGIFASVSAAVPAIASISMSPSSTSVNVGGTASLTATPRSAAGTSLTNRSVTWSASNSHISLSPSSGRTTSARGVSAGDSTATASAGGVTGSTSIHVRAFCETNVCFSRYQFNNWSNRALDLYQFQCHGSSCGWSFQITVPSLNYYLSDSLTEGDSYLVRAVEVGCAVNLLNCMKTESGGFFGGPGGVAVIEAF